MDIQQRCIRLITSNCKPKEKQAFIKLMAGKYEGVSSSIILAQKPSKLKRVLNRWLLGLIWVDQPLKDINRLKEVLQHFETHLANDKPDQNWTLPSND